MRFSRDVPVERLSGGTSLRWNVSPVERLYKDVPVERLYKGNVCTICVISYPINRHNHVLQFSTTVDLPDMRIELKTIFASC
ncbi:hypothetical protein H6G81_19875 [Scytonema hofmannii FACHB-248]|uniref:Uncharacterized protein n=1 Tax=Scytonema hofmannii FACHB-248 TaxID=1842502 RepID=A0ABR8GTD5_9CYAN|nr:MULTISPECIES: hypothetical protein [Nostocales]MBD2606731.1 hypothetical protein [Scytonema hofmannii FACHB-248]